MRVVFAGTPAFAAASLTRLLDSGPDLQVVAVLTQPDRPAGRGLRDSHSAVKALAVERGLNVLQPPKLTEPATLAELASLRADVWVVAAYGVILAPSVLALPGRGCLNVHASLLPRWRGAAPIQRALLAGDPQTGVSIMLMDAGLDTGPVLLRRAIPIGPTDTTGSLHDRLAALGADALMEALDGLSAGRHPPIPQDGAHATYAAKITKADTLIDWSVDAELVARRIRALDPAPGAQTTWRGSVLKLWGALPAETTDAKPGTVIGLAGNRLLVACGHRTVSIGELQRPGGRRLPVAEFLRGNDLSPGTALGG